MNTLQCCIIALVSLVLPAVPSENPELQAIKANAVFANALYKRLSKNDGNIVFSPLSAHSCLSMLYQGVSSPLLEDFSNVLNIPRPLAAAEGYQSIMSTFNASGNVTVLLANKIYYPINDNLIPTFKQVVEEKFHSEVEGIDFRNTERAAEAVNKWIKDKTKEKITNLLDPKDMKETLLVLINTIYFNGSWEHEFDKKHTNAAPFFSSAVKKMTVQMMHLTKMFYHTYNDELNARIVELKYVNSEYSMLIVLPNHRHDLAKVEARLLEKDLSEITRGAEMKTVQLAMPKFKFEVKLDLKKTFAEMGLENIFIPSSHFDGLLSTDGEMYVSEAIQKILVMVDETGSEAAAAPVVPMRSRTRTVSRMPPTDFKVDHPFIFLVCHHRDGNTGARNVLFYGRVYEPQTY